jgi:O-acetyl-ADP-ribose deacetylase (regulator of RNase III)
MILKERNINRVTVQNFICDITKENVDAIVNAANSNLKHGGGVAWAIVRAGGYEIQRESDGYVRTHGPVPTGEVAVTNGGNLKARYVIHAVGPVWRGGNHREEELLFKAVYNSLLKAYELGLESIAMPAISTGIYGFPKARAAKIFGKAIKKFLEDFPNTNLRLIKICHDNSSSKYF